MKAPLPPALVLVFAAAGCASSVHSPANAPSPASSASGPGPNWEEIDQTVNRVRERERPKRLAIETSRTVEAGFVAMTDEEYAAELDSARAEIRKANPKLADADVDYQATKRADEARRRQDISVTRRASSTYEIKTP